VNLQIQSLNILIEQEENDLSTIGWAPAETGAVQGLEHGFGYLGASEAAEVSPVLDLALLGRDAYDVWKDSGETNEKLRKLFKQCDH
jgi:hypothetical protein